MVKILLVTHGSLGKSFIETANLILGNTDNITAFGLYHGESPETLQARIEEFVKKNDDGDGILFLTDLLGGSPCNNIARVMKDFPSNKLECIVGVNLPIFIEAIANQNSPDLSFILKRCMSQSSTSILSLRNKFKFE